LCIIFAVSIFISFAMLHANVSELNGPELFFVETVMRVIVGFVIVAISLPSIIGGVGMLYNKSWAFTLILIVGIFSLVSFPMGTAIGIYTLWTYFRDQELKKNGGKEETFERRSN